MSLSKRNRENSSIFPSVDERKPDEEGGPIAREGFDWQDEVAVSFFIEMLSDPSILKVHCETHDDIIVVRENSSAGRVAEYVQVKAINQDKLWSVADLCKREAGKVGSSIFETSFGHDKHLEHSWFRIVTTRPVVSDLRPLTYPLDDASRVRSRVQLGSLSAELKRKFPDFQSEKKNDADYWVSNCLWDERSTDKAVRDGNFRQLSVLSGQENRLLLPDFVEKILEELRARVKSAGRARWESNLEQKIVTRDELRQWWEQKSRELIDGAATTGGGKLRSKMMQAGLSSDLIALALELRRDYAASVRTPRYLQGSTLPKLQSHAKANIVTLQAQLAAKAISVDSANFHLLCIETMNEINRNYSTDGEDYALFLQGFLYDVADRCLLRFEGASP